LPIAGRRKVDVERPQHEATPFLIRFRFLCRVRKSNAAANLPFEPA
jgi:hypothetical protein